MTINVINQTPAVLNALHTIPVKGAYDPVAAVQATLVDPLLVPLAPGTQTRVTDSQGNDVTGQILDHVLGTMDENIRPDSEDFVKQLLGQSLIHFDGQAQLPAGELFALQAGRKHKLKAPSSTVKYTATHDIIPAAKGLLAGSSDEDLFFASLAYAYHPRTLGIWFRTESEFDDFKNWLATNITLMTQLPGETTRLLGDVTKLSLKGLTESLSIRANDSDQNDEFSFARVIVNQFSSWVAKRRADAQAQGTDPYSGILPFNTSELFCPLALVMVNVETHARAKASAVASEWNLINQSLASPIKVISNRQLSKLTALQRNAKNASTAAAISAAKPGGSTRSAQVKFRKKAPSTLDLHKSIVRVFKHMGKVNKSQNVFRTQRTTFAKANRRDPNNYNLPGKSYQINYMPDLHIYLDCSGSISESNYQDAMLMLIELAKKLGINIYFSSFSHVLSQEVLLRTENKSKARIWQEFRKIPKVSGGTEFKQIWDYINLSNVRKRRLSLVITDFGWDPPSTREDHPKNLFYAPVSNFDWGSIEYMATHFAKSMQHIDSSVRMKMLGVYA